MALVHGVMAASTSSGSMVVVAWLDIDKYWFSLVPEKRVAGRHECIRGGDYIAPDVQGLKRNLERQRSVGEEGEIVGSTIVDKVAAKLFQDGPVVLSAPPTSRTLLSHA